MKVVKLITLMLFTISFLVGSEGSAIHAGANDANNVVCSGTQEQSESSVPVKAGGVQSPSVNQAELWIPDDPYVDEQWGLIKVHVSELWLVTRGSREVLVAVLDTGIDQNLEDLNGQIIAEVNMTDSPTRNDIYGHGTHIAGIIAAKDNGTGIIGLAPDSALLNVKVVNDNGICKASALAKGVVWAVDNGADVINISVEIGESSSELKEAVDYAWTQGAVVVAAAGNNGSQSPVYPAYYENCIAVAAIKQDDNLAPLSNHGDWVDVAAPGFGIYSTLPDNGYGYKSGTSFAAAYVSGIAALLFDMVVDTNGDGRLNDEVRAAIEAGCQEIGITGAGRGKIDAAKALASLRRE